MCKSIFGVPISRIKRGSTVQFTLYVVRQNKPVGAKAAHKMFVKLALWWPLTCDRKLLWHKKNFCSEQTKKYWRWWLVTSLVFAQLQRAVFLKNIRKITTYRNYDFFTRVIGDLPKLLLEVWTRVFFYFQEVSIL